MRTTKFRARVVLWWGIGLLLVGVLVELFLPPLTFGIMGVGSAGTTQVDQGLLTLLDGVLRVAVSLLTPVGTALLGAGVVMAYLERRDSALPAEAKVPEANLPE
jgi:hypothetical protein